MGDPQVRRVEPILAVERVVAGYDPGAPIIRGASLIVGRGEIVAVMGPNGAGKSTLIKAIAGLVPLTGGSIRLLGREITALATHDRMRRGLGFVPQTENVFASLTVADNLKLAADRLARAQRSLRITQVSELFPDLGRQRGLQAGRLSGGQRQMLAVARALIGEPQVLLLDEPSAGLSPKAVEDLFQKLKEICETGVSVVLVEQNLRAAFTIAHRGYVLAEGCNRLEGQTRTLSADPAFTALYLGAARDTPVRALSS